MKITPRLSSIIHLVENCGSVADIGTDHGYVPVYLIENKICKRAIASDVNIGPLNIAKDYIQSRKLSNKIETRLGNGLKVLNSNEADIAIIAGMGGLLIADILDESKEVARSIPFFILQPMTASDKLRKYLYNNGYEIVKEKLSKENERIYETMLVKHGEMKISDDINFEIGEKLIQQQDELLIPFIDKKLSKISIIMDNIKSNSNETVKYKQLQEKHNKILEVKKAYESERHN
ncbi:class I SAM-dependent methyltransferase [Clostridiaceae bacterium M8S5]|nr:class I SAM-dependent methyltransferase [Clostridiaceae bacterium M8S5]